MRPSPCGIRSRAHLVIGSSITTILSRLYGKLITQPLSVEFNYYITADSYAMGRGEPSTCKSDAETQHVCDISDRSIRVLSTVRMCTYGNKGKMRETFSVSSKCNSLRLTMASLVLRWQATMLVHGLERRTTFLSHRREAGIQGGRCKRGSDWGRSTPSDMYRRSASSCTLACTVPSCCTDSSGMYPLVTSSHTSTRRGDGADECR